MSTAVILPAASVETWERLGGGAVDRVDRIGGGGVCDVYRLAGAGPRGEAVVAKRTGRTVLDTEALVYAELARLDVPTAAVLGRTDDADPRFGWLFLTEVTGDPYRRLDPGHRLLAARWFARLHALTGGAPRPAGLPDHGPGRYHAQLVEAGLLLRTAAARGGPEHRVVTRLLHALAAVDAHWSAIADACAAIPSCLVHGDFRPDNAVVGAGPEFLLLDWETAGWGSPAPDLAELDLASYLAAATLGWPQVAAADLARAALAGVVLRQVASIAWEAESLGPEAPERVRGNLESYHDALVAAADAGGWLR